MRQPATAALLLTAWALVAAGVLQPTAGAAQTAAPSLGVDADPTGNTATSLGTLESCVAIKTGDTQEIDIYVKGVEGLLAWEAPLEYDPAVLEIVERDVKLFQAANEGSAVQDVSEELPDKDGRYLLAAFDSADPDSPDSGSGALARVTVKAIGPGVSEVALPLTDLNGDEAPDKGPFMRSVGGEPIADTNGDTLFDGQITGAQVAVDESCSGMPLPGTTPTAQPAGDGDGVSTTLIAGLAAGGGALLLLGLAGLWLRSRRSRQ